MTAREGGHASFAPGYETEIRIMEQLWREHGHASAERLSPYLARIPTFLITVEYPAFLGVSAILSEQCAHRH